MGNEIVQAIQRVIGFADPKEDPIASWSSGVWFYKGEVYAMNSKGGALAEVEHGIVGGVGAKALQRALKAVGEEEVQFSLSDAQIVLESSHGRARLPLRSKADAPKFPKPGKAEWAVVEGLSGVKRLAWCVGDNDRPHLACVWLDSEGMFSTNGSAAVKVGLESAKAAVEKLGGKPIPITPGVLEGLPAITYLSKVGERVFLSEDEAGRGWIRMATLPGVQMPALDQVMKPPKDAFQIRLELEALVDGLKRVKLAQSIVALELDSKAPDVLRASSPGAVSHESLFDLAIRIPIQDVLKGKLPAGTFQAGLDLRWTLPALEKACVGDYVDMTLGPSNLDPVFLEGPDSKVVVMPWRL
jgi:hypothetical protein